MSDAATRPRRMLLADAAELYGMKPSSLRRESAKGTLTTYRVAGKLWTTEDDMEAMFERCRQGARDQASTSSEGQTAPPAGSSATARGVSPQAATKALLSKLASPSL